MGGRARDRGAGMQEGGGDASGALSDVAIEDTIKVQAFILCLSNASDTLKVQTD